MHNINNHITIKDVDFAWEARSILNSISMQIPRGKVTAIMGPSGCGKTTLLRLIGAQLYPDEGEVIVDGHNIHRISTRDLFNERRKMGMLFQSAALFTNISVFENVAFPLREHTKLPEQFIHDIVLMKLEAVGLRGARHLMPSELSGGMARRVAIARAIALDPELIMYDEPFAGQDPISLGVLVKLIKTLNTVTGMTTIVVSHDIHETVSIADFIYVIADGQVAGAGTAEEIMASKTPQVRQFIRGLPDGIVPFHYPAKDFQKDLFNA